MGSTPNYSGSFSPSPAKPGTDWGGILGGIGAVAEGIGNMVGAARYGSDYMPQRMAGDRFQEYINKSQGKEDPLEVLMREILTKAAGKSPTLKKTGAGETFSIFS